MTTAYSPLLGLALPVTGELSGTWGTTVNDYITSYLDAAVAGAQTISGSQTAVTLSTTNGLSLSQVAGGGTGSAQYAIINCTGNPAGLLTITAPATSKAYIVINATSTSQSVKVVGAGPTTGVTMISGEKAVIAWNGSDFVKIASSTAVGDVVGPASATDNAVVRFDGTSGKLVQNSAVTIADTTGTITTAGSVVAAAGSVSAATYTTAGDLDTGVYFPAANKVALATGGTDRLVIDESIGYLYLSGTSVFTRPLNPLIPLDNPDKTRIYTNEITGVAGGSVISSGTLILQGNDLSGSGGVGVPCVVMSPSPAGCVGIGAAYTPAAKLHVYGASTSACNIRLENTSGRTWELNPYQEGTSENPFTIRDVTAGANRVAVSTNGDLLSLSNTGAVGYGTGAGSTVIQTTSRTTGVTINAPTGSISLVSAAGSTTWQTFTVTNSVMATSDTVVVNQCSGADLYEIHVTGTAPGSFKISFRTTGGTTVEQPLFNFAIIRGAWS